jgi:hypothetical protein
MAVIAVLMLTAFANDALADHDDAEPYTLTVIEWDDDGNGAIHDVYGPRDYFDNDGSICMERAMALGDYILSYDPNVRLVVACVHLNGTQPFDEFVQEFIDSYSAFFPKRTLYRLDNNA